MSVLTLHFKEPVLSETGEDTGKVKSMSILGVFVEGSALVAGLSEEVTAIIPLAEISWASVYEGAESGSDTEEPAGEGEGDDANETTDSDSEDAASTDGSAGRVGSEGSASILKPNFGGSVSDDEGAGS